MRTDELSVDAQGVFEMAITAIELRLPDPAGLPAAPAVPRLPEAGNVVPFVRRRSRVDGSEAADLSPPERLLLPLSTDRKHLRRVGFILASILVHAGVIALLTRAPEPRVGVEQTVILAELVMEAAAPAPSAAPAPPSDATPQVQPEHHDVAPPETAAATQEAKPDSREPPTPATTEDAPTEQAAVAPAAAEPDVTASTEPESRAVEPAPTVPPDRAAEPPPVSVPTHVVEPKPAPTHPAPPHTHATSKPKHDRVAALPPANTEKTTAGARAAPSPDPNYYGRIAAHLARFRQYPAEARANHSQGAATVTFTIDGGGRVTTVRLVRATGIESLDREAQAVAHRASPFPPPPTGHAMTFTLPVNFALR